MDSATTRMTGAEAVIRCLEAEGVTDVFGLPGGAILPLYDAWAACDHSIRHYLVRHELLALHQALALRRGGGGIGVVALCGGGGQGDALILRRREEGPGIHTSF